MVEAQEVESLGTSGEVRDPGLLGMQSQPERVQHSPRPARGPVRPVAGSRTGRRSRRQYLTSTPSRRPSLCHASSRTCSATLASSGEIGDPCGVPAPMADTIPPSNTPTRSQPRSSFSIGRSATRRSNWAIRASCEISSKQPWMSASSTHSRPWLTVDLTVSSASIADRFGPEPVARGQEVGLEDRLKHDLRRRHHHPVGHRGNPERPETAPAAPAWGYGPAATAAAGTFRPAARGEPVEEVAHPGALDLRRWSCHPRRAAPRLARTSPQALPHDVAAGDIVKQSMEPAFGILLGTAVKHALQGTNLVHAHRRWLTELADNGTHPGPSLLRECIDEAGALRSRRVVLSRRSALLRPPPTASRPPAISRVRRL